MKRPVSGKKAFYAMGQRDRVRNLRMPRYIKELPHEHWTYKAYVYGWNGF